MSKFKSIPLIPYRCSKKCGLGSERFEKEGREERYGEAGVDGKNEVNGSTKEKDLKKTEQMFNALSKN